jgi:glycosyltransferase involved in cell wall biosynthesis
MLAAPSDLPSSRSRVDVTVAICTWNRASLLDQTLARLGELAVPDALTWEILVVDNGSSDATGEVLARHASPASHLPLRSTREEHRGLSHARNRAVTEARGELIAWTDDDVQVDVDWLAAYAAAAHQLPHADFFGGPILPWFDDTPPAWVAASLPVIGSAFALCDLGSSRAPFSVQHLPYGANFAVRTAVQRRHLFDPALGRVGDELLWGDEHDALRRMLADGHTGTWLPEARVRHFVPRERMTLDYVRRYYRGIGRTDVRVHGGGKPRWWNLALSGAKAFAKAARCRARRSLGRSHAWVCDLRDSSIHRGRFEAFLNPEAERADKS